MVGCRSFLHPLRYRGETPASPRRRLRSSFPWLLRSLPKTSSPGHSRHPVQRPDPVINGYPGNVGVRWKEYPDAEHLGVVQAVLPQVLGFFDKVAAEISDHSTAEPPHR